MQFAAKISIGMITNYIDSENWEIEFDVLDGTGNFFSYNVMPGNIIYLDGSIFGMGILRYSIVSISEYIDGTKVKAQIQWKPLNPELYPMEPYYGALGIIGETTDKTNMVVLPSASINSIEESFMNSIQNYEKDYIIDEFAPLLSPNFLGTPLAPQPDINNENSIATVDFVEDKIEEETSIIYGGTF